MNLPDADEILLGELLSGAQDFQSVAPVLSADDFPRPEHQHIFKCMADLSDRGEPIDRVTVANELLKANLLEEVGGLSYLVNLDDYGRCVIEFPGELL